jgi:hypothetical protein
MRKFSFCFYLCILLSIAVVSCGPKTRVDIDESKRCVPRNLMLVATDNNYARIAWDPGCPGIRIMSGFNIYLSPTPLTGRYSGHDLPGSVIPHNREIYPGDTLGDPKRETYECKDIENATVYYAHVRAVYSDNTLSVPSNEIEIIAYPQGEISLAVSYSGENDGFSFIENDYCRTDDIENDIYFYHKDGIDYLCSPSRLGPVNRMTKIFEAGKAPVFDKSSDIIPSGDYSERIPLVINGIYIIETEEGYPARLRVKAIDGSGNTRMIKFEYLFKPPAKRRGNV